MPEIIFTDEERDEIERLVATHSPMANPELVQRMSYLHDKVRNQIIDSHEADLRETAKLALVLRNQLDGLLDGSQEAREARDYSCGALHALSSLRAGDEPLVDRAFGDEAEAFHLLVASLVSEVLGERMTVDA